MTRFIAAVPEASCSCSRRQPDARRTGNERLERALRTHLSIPCSVFSQLAILARCALRLEPPHLARRGCTTMSRPSADDPSHRGIMAQPLGAVDVLVSGKPTEHRLPQHTDKSVPAVLAGAGVGKPLASRLRKAESIIKLAICKKPSIRGNDRTAKLEHQPAVEIEPKRLAIRFTRRVRSMRSGDRRTRKRRWTCRTAIAVARIRRPSPPLGRSRRARRRRATRQPWR